VFENYSKFISSIDTVRRMKDNICMVDDKLKVLDSSMERISKLALQIDETFKFKRKEIQKLDTVNKDLQKLRNLCDFPNVLKQDLMEYKSISENKISQAFSNEPSLFNKSILAYEECFQTLEDLKA
jgi:beta-N-acetylglucosaminidase